MCGFFSYFGSEKSANDLAFNADKISYRGPDNTTITTISDDLTFIFHRLAINDLSELGNQPLYHPDDSGLSLVCNGEIYNHKELSRQYGLSIASSSDCEIILHLYKKLGIEKTVRLLDGVFAFTLYDESSGILYAARDAIGVRPAFFGTSASGDIFISSEMKAIVDLSDSVMPFPPGSWWSSSFPQVFTGFYQYEYPALNLVNEADILEQINRKLKAAVSKRMLSDREIGCLLSGGLDSSLIAALVQKESSAPIKTFAIGMPGSPDLKYAKIVADWIGSDHYEVKISEKDFLGAIEDVIYKIESYDTTTVRASVGNYLVSKYIRENSDCKVVFNGDGSDEVCCGYVYNANAPDDNALEAEAIKLVREIHLFDVLRSDRSVASNGLEARTPFLDKDFVDYYMSIPYSLKSFDKVTRMEKDLLRRAFEPEKLLPPEILWRDKCAFSDGVSDIKKSWHKIIQEYIDTKISDEEFMAQSETMTHCKPLLKESFYYRKVFEKFFGNTTEIIPHFWMPNWTDVIDPSARELSNYSE